MTGIQISKRSIEPGLPTYVVAEIGFNHEGRIDLAFEMIRSAASAGVDAVKFQTFRAARLVFESAEHFDVIKKAEIAPAAYPDLIRAAHDAGVEFFSTPFDFESLETLMHNRVPAIKIASMDLTNLPLLRAVGEYGRPVLLSTGMGTIAEIERAVDTVSATGNDQIVILHCISIYPAPMEKLHLKTIDQLRGHFPYLIGYSDHSMGNVAALTAASMGASIIEKHFTSDKSLPGPDHRISSGPDEMADLVRDIRMMESATGDPCADDTRPDRDAAKDLRRGLYAAVDIPAGREITGDMILCVRPANDLAPDDSKKIVGGTARCDISRNSPITWDSVQS